MISRKFWFVLSVAVVVFPSVSYPCTSSTPIDGGAYGFFNLASKQFLSPGLSLVGDLKDGITLHFQDTIPEHRFYITTLPEGRGSRFTATSRLGNISLNGQGGLLWCVHGVGNGNFYLENHEGNGCLKSTGTGVILGGCSEAQSLQPEYLWRTEKK